MKIPWGVMMVLALLVVVGSVNLSWAEGPISPTPTSQGGTAVSPTNSAGVAPVSPTGSSGTKPLNLQEEIDKYIDQLTDDNPRVEDEARTALLEIGPPAVPALLKALESEKPTLRYMTCEILVKVRDKRALPGFLKELTDKEDVGRSIASVAAEGLGLLGEPSVITPLMKALATADGDVDLRYETITSLGILRAAEAVPVFLSVLTDTARTNFNYLVQCAVIEALGKIKAADAVKPLINLLNDNSEEPATERPVVYYVIKALENITGASFGTPTKVGLKDDKKKQELIKQWQDWWDKNKVKYGEVPPPPPPPKPPVSPVPPEPKPKLPETPPVTPTNNTAPKPEPEKKPPEPKGPEGK